MNSSLIAATKLAIPKPLRAIVPRPELLARLNEPTYRVGVVCAPAGFGKTVLLATWAADRRERPAWLSCDVTDREPTRFWTGLLTALSARWPGVGDDAAIELERAGPDSHDLAISVANDLGEVEHPVVIVIDDLHLAKPAPHVLADLASMMPVNVRLVIGTRVDPPFSLARHRVAGSLLEIRSDELRFSVAETAALLAGNNATATSAELQGLHELTEGWPAGVQLAALSLQRSSDRARFLEAFAATDRAITDFLVNEVLDSQPADRVEFLHETSVLDEFDIGLCEEVTGRQDAAALLQQVVAANLFVVPLDDTGGWYRYHHLFGALLRARLKSRGREHLRAAHERASRALEARGDVVGALQQASASGDLERAATVVRNTMGRWMNVIDPGMSGAAARYWLNEHGAQFVVSDPERVLEFVLALVVSSGPDDAVHWLNRIEQAHPDGPSELTAYLQAVWAEHNLHHGQPEEGLRRARVAMAAVDGVPPDRNLFPMIYPMFARAHLDAGDVAGARATLDAAISRSAGHPALDDVRLPGMRAWVAFLEGELVRAEQWARSARQRAADLDLAPHEPGRLFAGLALAGVLWERTDDVAAATILEGVSDGVDVGRRPPLQSLVALRQAEFARLTGDEAAADSHLTRARLLLPTASPSVKATFAIEAAQQALRFQPATAADAIDDLDDSPAATVLRVKRALVDGHDGAAMALLDTLSPPTTPREHVERGVLCALAISRRDVEAANRQLADCVDVARSERFIRTIIDHGPMVSKLLSAFTPNRAVGRYVEELIDANSSMAAPLRQLVATPLVDPLSPRELTVLRYLSSRLTNQEIASALYVSLNTLKSHVKSVYRKLAVASRQEAVEAGRHLRLI